MEKQVIPDMPLSISLYSLQYITGSVYEKSVDNVNCDVDVKRKPHLMSAIFMTTAYTYDQARKDLFDYLLSKADLYLKDVVIKDYSSVLLSDAFDEAFDKYSDKEFKEENSEEVVEPSEEK